MFFAFLSFIFSSYFYFAMHFTGNNAFPQTLTQDEENKYFMMMKNGTNEKKKEAKEKLVIHNLRLVAHVIKKYYANEEKEDLISIGTIGLIKAINSYKQDKGTRFATYAGKCIENEVLMYFRGLKKSNQDIYINDSIDTDKDGNDITLVDKICDNANTQEETEMKMKIEYMIKAMDRTLTQREREIIILRYGLGGIKPLNQRTIAKKLNISRSYVSRIEKKVIGVLKDEFKKSE